MTETGCIALVVGAGRGQRFGGDAPKQYADLGGMAVMARTLDAFAAHPGVNAVQAVIHSDDRDLYEASAHGLSLLQPVIGGKTRQESVLLGLESMEASAPARVLIHDAARPFVSENLIGSVLGTLESALDTVQGVAPALAVSDTLKRAGTDGLVSATVPRDGLFRIQTPQAFRFIDILAAHRRMAGTNLTDDAAVMEEAGGTVRLVEGDADNLKITSPADMARANRILGRGNTGETRTGIGFDVHRFGPGDHVMLLGVPLPFTQGLEGHSDADVAMHALTDAILGAAGLGDIGEHFPPGDPTWKDAASTLFLARTAEMVQARGGRLINVDITIICEDPKIAPHRDAMRAKVTSILKLNPEQVNVKGTTTERLGFTGRGEGIAAQAIASVVFPT